MSIIKKIRINYCNFPLKIGYKLSYGTINAFDTIIIEIEDDEKRKAYGEATFLLGYSNERPEESFNISEKIGKKILNLDINDAKIYLEKFKNTNPFLITAFFTTLENLSRNYSNKNIKVPVIGLINVSDEKSIKNNIESLINMDYKIVKTKICINSMKEDFKKIKLIDKYADGELKIRVDANQSLENQNIVEIIKEFSSINLQFLEQPFKKDNLDKHLELNEKAPFPTMLDESIWNFKDINIVSEKKIADYIKLKLQKCGSLMQFKSMIEYIKEKNIKVIIGNGVQTDLNCILEGQMYDICQLNEAAENIGFSKLLMPVTKNKVFIKNGTILINNSPIEIRYDIINKYIISKKIVGM